MKLHADPIDAMKALFDEAQDDARYFAGIVDDLRCSIAAALVVLPGRWRDAEPARKILREAMSKSTLDIAALERRALGEQVGADQ